MRYTVSSNINRMLNKSISEMRRYKEILEKIDMDNIINDRDVTFVNMMKSY